MASGGHALSRNASHAPLLAGLCLGLGFVKGLYGSDVEHERSGMSDKKDWQWAEQMDVTVNAMLNADRCQPLENIIIQLVKDKMAYLEEIERLQGIAPRKVTLSDGRVMVWHCPDELL